MSKQTYAAVTVMVVVADLVADLDQQARHSPEKIERLMASLAAEKQLQAIGVVEGSNKIIYGHGRYLAAKRLGWERIEAKVYPANLTETEIQVIRWAENFHRSETTPFQRFKLCQQILESNPDFRAKDLADLLHVTPGMVTRLLSPAKAGVPWIEALEGRQVSLEECYTASRLDEPARFELLAAKRDQATAGKPGGSRRRAVQVVKSRPAVKRAKVAIPVGGAMVAVTGIDIGMPEVEQSLAAALAEVRQSPASGDLKQFQSLMREKAKKGGESCPAQANP